MSLENYLIELLEPALQEIGYNIVRVQLRGTKRKTLQVMIERLDEIGITLDDCTQASRTISMLLDVDDSIVDSYLLEVSSPGLERPLVKLIDFDRFKDQDVKIELKVPHQGSKRFKGKLLGLEGEKIKIMLVESQVEVEFEYINIQKAQLLPDYGAS